MQKIDMETQSLNLAQGVVDARRVYAAPALVLLADADTEAKSVPGADVTQNS